VPDPLHAEDVRDVLTTCRTVAVLGASDGPDRPAFYVPQYLHDQGYDVYGVSPRITGAVLWGHPVVARLADVPVPIDLVDVFRRSDDVPGHLDELLALSPRPKVVWLQQGIRHDAVADALRAVGIRVVQDRCTYADHRRLGLTCGC